MINFADQKILEIVKSKDKQEIGNFDLIILRGYIYAHLAHMMIYDSENKVLFNSRNYSTYELHEKLNIISFHKYDKILFSLPKGEYTVRLTIDGQFTDNLIVLDKDKICSFGENIFIDLLHDTRIDHKFNIPVLYSSIPLDGKVKYNSTQDYYVKGAIMSSKKNTLKIPKKISSGIFIFLHYADKDIFKNVFKSKTYWSKFTLYDLKNEIVMNLSTNSVINNDLGYLGFSADLIPGLYYLKYSGAGKRTIPIYVFRNWYTQVFMVLGKQPLFGSLKVVLDNQKKFDSKNVYHSYIDILLSKLQNKDYTLDKHLLDVISYGKYNSPLLGLLGTYVYLLSKESKDNNLFKTIINNLKRKILIDSEMSQDIYALNFLSNRHFGYSFTEQNLRINDTAMFRIAYDTIRIAAARDESVILENSLNDKIAENQYFDSILNTFRSITFKRSLIGTNKRKTSIQDVVKDEVESYDENFREIQLRPKTPIKLDLDYRINKELEESSIIDLNNTFNYVTLKNFELIKLEPLKKNITELQKLLDNSENIGIISSWVVGVMISRPGISPEDIAKEINLPISTVKRVQRKLKI